MTSHDHNDVMATQDEDNPSRINQFDLALYCNTGNMENEVQYWKSSRIKNGEIC